ncbi:unnamed protein product [Cochlearia groenlandica]
MVFQMKTTIISIAVLVLIVAMTVSKVDCRLNVAYFGRNLLDDQTSKIHVKIDGRRNLYDIVSAMTGKAPTPKASTSKAPSPKKSKAPSPKKSKAPTPKSSKAPSLKKSKAPTPKSSKAPAPKSSKTSISKV